MRLHTPLWLAVLPFTLTILKLAIQHVFFQIFILKMKILGPWAKVLENSAISCCLYVSGVSLKLNKCFRKFTCSIQIWVESNNQFLGKSEMWHDPSYVRIRMENNVLKELQGYRCRPNGWGAPGSHRRLVREMRGKNVRGNIKKNH